LYACLRLLP